MAAETATSIAASNTISASVPVETAQHLQRIAEQEGLTVADIVERAVEEYVRCQRFPGILFVTGGSGRRKAVLREGGSVWGIVFNARGFEMDAQETADHLGIPVEDVQLALDYYAAYPEDTDARLRHMEEFDKDPRRFCPDIRIINVSDLADETPA